MLYIDDEYEWRNEYFEYFENGMMIIFIMMIMIISFLLGANQSNRFKLGFPLAMWVSFR